MALRKTSLVLVLTAFLAAQFANALTTVSVYATGLSGFDGTSGASYALASSDLNKLNSSDDDRYAVMNGWPAFAYDNASLTLAIPSLIPYNDSQVAVKHVYSTWEHRKQAGWTTAVPGNCESLSAGEAKLTVFDGANSIDVTITNLWPAENDVDNSFTVDLAGALDSASKVNSGRVSFVAWGRLQYSAGGFCFVQRFDTRHDLVSLNISYGLRPTQPAVDVTPEAPYTDDDLACAVTTPSTDPDGNSANIVYEFQWSEDGAPIPGQTGTVLPASETEKNKVYTCAVTPRDEEGDAGTAGTDSVTVLNTPPTATAVSITPDPAYTADDLYCNATAFDADGDALTYAYQWSEDGVDLPGQNVGTLSAALTTKHRAYGCNATPNDGEAAGPAGFGSTTVLNTPPAITVTSPNGGEKWGGSHSIAWIASDADGDNFSMQVLYSPDNGAAWTAIASSDNDGTEAFDTTASADGDQYLARVSGDDGEGTSFDDSDAAFSVDNTPPVTSIILPATAFPSTGTKWYNYSGIPASLSAADWPAGFNQSFCSIQNNATIVDCSSSSNPNNFTVDAEGENQVVFYSNDLTDATNTEAPQQVTVGIDLLAPTAPANLVAPALVTAPSVPLSWEKSSDAANGSGVCGYRVYANASFAAQVDGADNTSYSFTAVADGNTYEFSVTAVDCAGSESPASNTVSTTVDLAEPTPTPTPAPASPPQQPSGGGPSYPIPQHLQPTPTPTPAPTATPGATPTPVPQLNFSQSPASPPPSPTPLPPAPTPTATPAPSEEPPAYASAATGLFTLSDSWIWLGLFALLLLIAGWYYRKYRKRERSLLNA
ncbi:MAG: hypothetical protein AB1626_00480 [Candidatus Micrarchaeota archaeon]